MNNNTKGIRKDNRNNKDDHSYLPQDSYIRFSSSALCKLSWSNCIEGVLSSCNFIYSFRNIFQNRRSAPTNVLQKWI